MIRSLRLLGLLSLVLASASAASAQDGDAPWSVPGFTVEIYRHPVTGDQEGAGLRFIGTDGKLAAEFPGKGDTEAWSLVTDEIRLPGVAEPIAAFTHYSGGAHCCSAVELFRLGPTPTRFATSLVQEGDGATIVETTSGWIVPSHDMSFAYGMDRSFATSPFPPAYWRLTPAGFVPAPELQKAGPDGLPALFGQCRLRGRNMDGDPTCGGHAVQPMTDAALADAVAAVVAKAGGDAHEILRELPAQAIEGIAEGRAALVFDTLSAAGAPPVVARKLVQAFAARRYWPQIVALNGVEAMLTPLAGDGHAVGAAIAGDRPLLPLGLYGGPTLGFIDLGCNGEGHVRLLDAFGGSLGELTMIGCPRLEVPGSLLAEEAWPAAMVATGQDGGRGIVAITKQGGLVVPVDDETIEIDSFTDADKDGRPETVKLESGTRSVTCPLSDVAGTMGCIDQFSAGQ